MVRPAQPRYRGRCLSVQRILFVLCATAVSVSVLAATATLASAGSDAAGASPKPNPGRDLYRKFCGQCHSLAAARAVGFGSNKGTLGKLGGPSFNELKVPYAISVRHVTQPTGGHERHHEEDRREATAHRRALDRVRHADASDPRAADRRLTCCAARW